MGVPSSSDISNLSATSHTPRPSTIRAVKKETRLIKMTKPLVHLLKRSHMVKETLKIRGKKDIKG